jgi:hypothetical protein
LSEVCQQKRQRPQLTTSRGDVQNVTTNTFDVNYLVTVRTNRKALAHFSFYAARGFSQSNCRTDSEVFTTGIKMMELDAAVVIHVAADTLI